MTNEILIKPIGIIHSELKQRYESPRQGVLSKGSRAEIHLLPNNNFEQAVKDLDGFERIWVIYQFHLNKNWKPLVTPPRHTRKKIGVFATRAPYRPNHIGLSCVKLDKIDGLKIFISESDILDGSPVLDIKPYLPYSDAFTNSKTGWVKSEMEIIYEVVFDDNVEMFCNNLKRDENVNLLNYANVQLEFNPTDTTRKRISLINKEENKNSYALAYQKWDIHYSVSEVEKKVFITEVKFIKRRT